MHDYPLSQKMLKDTLLHCTYLNSIFTKPHIMNLSCLLCYQASPTPVCQWCENDIFFFNPSVHGHNLLRFGPVARHVKHSAYKKLVVLSVHCYPITTLIHSFKFHHSLTCGRVLSKWFIDKQQHVSADKPHVILPVPISPWRFATRHYNQAAVLAKHIGNALHVPVCTNWAIRRGTSSQHHLNRQARVQHAREVFALSTRCIDNLLITLPALTHVAIVDDVITTGVTVNALASLLTTRYPQLTIYVWTITFTLPPKSSLLPSGVSKV